MRNLRIGGKAVNKSWSEYYRGIRGKKAKESQKIARDNFYSLCDNLNLVKNTTGDKFVISKKVV